MTSYWRKTAAPVIAEILAKRSDREAEDKLLFDAYPFGERANHPYKIWLNEIKRQRGELPSSRDGNSATAGQRLKEWEAIYGRRTA